MIIALRVLLITATIGLLSWGLLEQRHWPDWQWLLCITGAGFLLILALWPVSRRRTPIFNKTVIRISIVLLVVFLVVTVQLVRIQVVESSRTYYKVVQTADNDVVQNPRILISSEQHERGRIVAPDGTVLAESVPDADGTVSRVYAEPSTAGLIGYYSPVLFGASGIESAANDYLTGGDGGNPVTEWFDSVLHRNRPGYDVELSIDLELQRLATELLAGYQGAAVLLDAETGEVLAMAGSPAVDTGRLSSSDFEDARQYWHDTVEREDGPLLFRPTQGLYTPGSTFKTVTAAAAIDSGSAVPQSGFRDEGVFEVEGRVIVEPNRPDDTRAVWTLEESYAYSLNVVFAQLGLQVGAQELQDFADQLGFGASIPFDLPVEPSQLTNDSASLESRTLLADTGYGQGEILVTPLQMALVVAAIENQGEMPEPFVISEVREREGKVLESRSPKTWRTVMKPETAAAMRDLLLASTSYGYASGAQIDGIIVGGKTGTAETGAGEPDAWFIGFAEHENSKYVVAVVLENGGRGGDTALPIGRELLQAATQ